MKKISIDLDRKYKNMNLIARLMMLVSVFTGIQFLVFLWPDVPIWGRNWSPLNEYIH
jgi:hypothetical protein